MTLKVYEEVGAITPSNWRKLQNRLGLIPRDVYGNDLSKIIAQRAKDVVTRKDCNRLRYERRQDAIFKARTASH